MLPTKSRMCILWISAGEQSGTTATAPATRIGYSKHGPAECTDSGKQRPWPDLAWKIECAEFLPEKGSKDGCRIKKRGVRRPHSHGAWELLSPDLRCFWDHYG